MNPSAPRLVSCGILLVFTCCGCASRPLGHVPKSGGQAVSSAFTINLYCSPEDELSAGTSFSQEDTTDPDVSSQPVPRNAEREEKDNTDSTDGGCASLVESMRNGAEDLLTKAKLERALSY